MYMLNRLKPVLLLVILVRGLVIFTKSLTLFYFQDIRIGSEFKNHLHNTLIHTNITVEDVDICDFTFTVCLMSSFTSHVLIGEEM